jgi:hypothetical protein
LEGPKYLQMLTHRRLEGPKYLQMLTHRRLEGPKYLQMLTHRRLEGPTFSLRALRLVYASLVISSLKLGSIFQELEEELLFVCWRVRKTFS